MVELINNMKSFFANENARRLTLHGAADRYKKVWESLFKDIALIDDNKSAETKLEDLFDILNHMKNWIMFDRTTVDTLKFFKDYTLLIHNWNNNSHNSHRIQNECQFIINLIDGNLTMRDTIGILKNINKRMMDLRSWNPPAFEISKHLLNSLDK